MRIGILASPDNRITDYYLGNQLIRNFDVPVVLIQSPAIRTRRGRWFKAARRMISRGPTGTLLALRNRRYEQVRQREFSIYLSRYFDALGEYGGYDSGPEIIEVDDVHAADSIRILKDCGVTLLFQNGAGIIRRSLIDFAEDGVLNVHHGYLPYIRGCHSIAWGLLENRMEWIGVSVHLIDEGIDTGPILKRKHLPVQPDGTYASLFCEATVLGGQLLTEAVADLSEGDSKSIPHHGQGTYRPAMTKKQWEMLSDRRNRLSRPTLVREVCRRSC